DGLTYPLDLDPSTFVQTDAEAAAQVAEEATDPTAAVTTIGRNMVTNDLTVRGTLTTSGTNLAIDTNLLYLDSANSRVGIGTTSPTTKLQVAGTVYSTTGGFKLPDGTILDSADDLGGGDISDIYFDNTTHIDGAPTIYGSGIIYKDGVPFFHDFNYGNNGTVTTDGYNIFIGEDAGNFTMGATAEESQESSYNIGIGFESLTANTTGDKNVAMGSFALKMNDEGIENTAIGFETLNVNTYGSENVAIGSSALPNNTEGGDNVAVGAYALYDNTIGEYNSAFGYGAGSNTSDWGENQTTNNSVYIGAETRASVDGVENENVFGYAAVGIGSNTVVLGNDEIVTTALKGAVGIGTTEPTQPLEVAGTIYSTTGGFKLPDGTVLDSATDLGGGESLWTENEDSSIYYSLGNVGIGTTTPASELHINDSLGIGQITLGGLNGGCLMIRDTDGDGWTQCTTLNGTLSCTWDDDGICTSPT
ncbi:MAG: hypothetical protein WCV72_04245, partial [Patescibacteria group bacterium]